MCIENKILEGTLTVYKDKGLKFTMDDVARTLGMSKKTIYKVFDDKEAMFLAMVDYIFDSIKVAENEILEDSSLDTLEKIRRILCVLPDGYKDIDFGQLYDLKSKYPKIYEKVEMRLETGWEPTISLIEQGISEGVIRQINITIVKMMFEASLEHFFQRDVLYKNKLSYRQGLAEVVSVILDGIVAK